MQRSALVAAGPSQVFERLADHERCNDFLYFLDEARFTTSAHRGVGARARHRGRMMGMRLKWDGEVVEWEDGKSVTWRAVSGLPSRMKMRARWTLEPRGANTEVALMMAYDPPLGTAGRFFDALLMRREVTRMTEGSLARLAQLFQEG